MRTAAREALIELAQKAGPLGKIVKSVTDGGMVGPKALRSALEAAGYKVTDKKLDVRHQVEVSKGKDDLVVARGLSDSKEDALLQAIYSAVKEEHMAVNNLTLADMVEKVGG